MKKILAVVLAITLCLGVAPMAFAITVPAFEYKQSEVAADGTFTITATAPANITALTGVNMYFAFDPMVLELVTAGPCGWTDSDNNFTENFSGYWEHGMRTNGEEYAFGFMSGDGVDKRAAKDMLSITFKVIDPTATSTTINVYFDEFKTADGDDTNDIISNTFAASKTIVLTPSSSDPNDKPSEIITSEPTADDISDLIQIIRDMLSGNGATFQDFADAITNLLGNADLTDMIEQLVGGGDIGEAFQNLLNKLGIDMGGFEDILNKIIDFFKGLFGGDDETKAPTSNNITTNNSGATDTTKSGSGSGAEDTGDAGIALAATVCVAAAAAFVMTRKKKEFAEE